MQSIGHLSGSYCQPDRPLLSRDWPRRLCTLTRDCPCPCLPVPCPTCAVPCPGDVTAGLGVSLASWWSVSRSRFRFRVVRELGVMVGTRRLAPAGLVTSRTWWNTAQNVTRASRGSESRGKHRPGG